MSSLLPAPRPAGISGPPFFAEDKSIKVGIISGEDEDVWRVVVGRSRKEGLEIETVVFNDYTQPNEALERGESTPTPSSTSLISTTRSSSTAITSSMSAIPASGRSASTTKKFKDRRMPEGAVIGVPNDPSNEGRALRVLQNEGVIKLKDGTGILATVADIVENPKKVEIKELDAGVVGRSIDDLDAAVVNTDWALKSGLTPETASRRSRLPTILTATSSPSRPAARMKPGSRPSSPPTRTIRRQGRVRQGLQGHRRQRLLIHRA
jgi:D-methionine transport system substrate-binding protein